MLMKNAIFVQYSKSEIFTSFIDEARLSKDFSVHASTVSSINSSALSADTSTVSINSESTVDDMHTKLGSTE